MSDDWRAVTRVPFKRDTCGGSFWWPDPGEEMTVDIRDLMDAHFDGIARELKEIRLRQESGFAEIKAEMATRDAHIDRDIQQLDHRVTRVEQTMNRWGGAFAVALLFVTIGMPFAVWVINRYLG